MGAADTSGEEHSLHAFLKARGFFPEEPLPGGEVGPLEQGVLQDALHSSQGLDDICPVVVQVPQLAVMALVGPPEGVLLEHLVLLEVSAHAPPLVIGQGVPVLLEQRVDPGNSSVPGIFQVLQCPNQSNARQLGCATIDEMKHCSQEEQEQPRMTYGSCKCCDGSQD